MAKMMYGEGAVDQLPSGKWRARVRVEGKLVAVQPGVTYDSERAARAALSAVRTDRGRGDWIDPKKGRITLTTYASQTLAERKELSAATVAHYRSMFKHIDGTALGRTLMAELDTPKVRRWHAALVTAVENGELGRSIPAKAYKALRALCTLAVSDEVMKSNPCRIKGAGQEHTPERPTVEPEQLDGLIGFVPERFHATIEVGVTTGLRYGELFGLRRMDIDLLHNRLHVRGVLEEVGGKVRWRDYAKTKAGTGRVIHFDPILGEALTAHMAAYTLTDPEAFVFTGARACRMMLRSSWGRIWRKARESAGLPEVHLHDLRHTAATWMAEEGATDAELMAFLGHADRDMIARYTHAREGRKADMAGKLAARRVARAGAVSAIK